MFILSTQIIKKDQKQSSRTNSSIGAVVTFEGIVRSDKHEGKEVSSLLYIADEAACRSEGEKIIQETISMFSIIDAVCIQRTGQVGVGESGIWIGVWSSHRDEAFKACRYIIEEIKLRLLIWKKEFFKDGTSHWVKGQSQIIP
ncbi:MAG: molybdenum cofactor biosynthesis protein MoaE [Candidatus Omnitrophica bacterium]|nr:molybdenum cofactor biosynthesis protein MoaE [Candidatus Omnitrophota bacterium]